MIFNLHRKTHQNPYKIFNKKKTTRRYLDIFVQDILWLQSPASDALYRGLEVSVVEGPLAVSQLVIRHAG